VVTLTTGVGHYMVSLHVVMHTPWAHTFGTNECSFSCDAAITLSADCLSCCLHRISAQLSSSPASRCTCLGYACLSRRAYVDVMGSQAVALGCPMVRPPILGSKDADLQFASSAYRTGQLLAIGWMGHDQARSMKGVPNYSACQLF
jgi:hypothetical protein